jgi:radical SAM superfamily enzyme YgiQ (UPF0313 family)
MNKRPMDTDLKTRMSPSLALLTLMRLTPDGHEVRLLNENAERLDFSCEADLVGVTVTLDVMPRARFISDAFRKRGIPVIAGGIHVTCRPETCLPHFDAVCVGPAERVWPHIIADAEAGRLKGEYRDFLDFRGEEIASPLYSRIEQGRYLYTNVLTASRGCPNRCAFCYNSCANRFYTVRPITDVLRDIKALGTRHVLFIDDNFIGRPDYTRKLLRELAGMNLIWGAAVTTAVLDEPGLIDLMAESGCQSLFIGFESINAASLADMNKANRVERYEQLVDAIHSRGIMVNASMVFGSDGDDAGTFQRTLDWLVSVRVETLTSHILTPYPGTELYRRLDEAGRITDRRLEHYNTAHVVFRPKHMTAEELYAGYLWMYKQFYSLQSIIRRYPKEKAQRRSYLLFNLLYRKYGAPVSALTRIIPMRTLGKLAAYLSYKV